MKNRDKTKADTDDAWPVEGAGIRTSLFQPKEGMDPASFYGRCATLALILAWNWSLVGYDYRSAEINGSFMHNIIIPIHEAGHVLLSPFGQFMMMLGGSLFQLALPVALCIAFMRINRDNFGAALCLCWASISLVELSAYIYDSLHPEMVLIGGYTGEDGPHDWIYLLNAVGQLHNARHWGAFTHFLGSLLAFSALAWAAAVLWRQWMSQKNFV